jgi:hypothetical protein
MSTITTKFVTDNKLIKEMSLEELSQYAPEILELLTTSVPLVDKEKGTKPVIAFKKDMNLAKNRHLH